MHHRPSNPAAFGGAGVGAGAGGHVVRPQPNGRGAPEVCHISELIHQGPDICMTKGFQSNPAHQSDNNTNTSKSFLKDFKREEGGGVRGGGGEEGLGEELELSRTGLSAKKAPKLCD